MPISLLIYDALKLHIYDFFHEESKETKNLYKEAKNADDADNDQPKNTN